MTRQQSYTDPQHLAWAEVVVQGGTRLQEIIQVWCAFPAAPYIDQVVAVVAAHVRP
jgi:hypothetical protein